VSIGTAQFGSKYGATNKKKENKRAGDNITLEALDDKCHVSS
jgi:hypothetical protein